MGERDGTTVKLSIPNGIEVSDGYHTFSELYDHRIGLYIALCRLLATVMPAGEVWRANYHSDGTSIDGWFVLGICTEAGKQITYHLPIARWKDTDFVGEERSLAPTFDGHTSADVLARISRLV